ncbi:MAG: hypothetical protein HQL51_12840 [Magnetococcales bacterium]|nr:hypothetical protein [Magnetococcales bacterium]
MIPFCRTHHRSFGLFHGVAAALLTIVVLASSTAFASGSTWPEALLATGEGWDPKRPDLQDSIRPGILRGDQSIYHRFIFYRRLLGLPVTAEDRDRLLWRFKEVKQGEDHQDGPEVKFTGADKIWRESRLAVPGAQELPPLDPFRKYRAYDNDVVDPICFDDAYRTATTTLNQRIARKGADHPEVREWLRGQDQVFANCEGSGRIPELLTNASEDLKADRAYQRAAALYYQNRLDEALVAFREIAADPASPWHRLAVYLQARTLVQQALACLQEARVHFEIRRDMNDWRHEPPMPLPDAARRRMEEARRILFDLLKDPEQTELYRAARLMINRIDVQLNPVEQADALERRLLAQKLSDEAPIELEDFIILMGRGKNPSCLGQWMSLFVSKEYDHDIEAMVERRPTSEEVLNRWRRDKTLPWLVAALVITKVGDAWLPEIVAAAEQISDDSPAALTLGWHRARLLIQQNRPSEARNLLDHLLALKNMDQISRNLLTAARMTTARSLTEWLKDAPRTLIYIDFIEGWSEKADAPITDSRWSKVDWRKELLKRKELHSPNPRYFDEDASISLNRDFPLDRLVEIVRHNSFEAHLRRDLALGAWTRAVILERYDAVNRLAPEMKRHFPELAEPIDRLTQTTDDKERNFLAAYLALKMPGGRPFFDSGFGYLYSPDKIGSNGGRWWSGPRKKREQDGWIEEMFRRNHKDLLCNSCGPHGLTVDPPALLTTEERQQAKRENERLSNTPGILAWGGARIFAWEKEHRRDPLLPEALHHLTKCGRYSFQTGDASRIAWKLLHDHYPKTSWAKKTPYWYENKDWGE